MENNLTTTIKSGSTCSSRTSLTSAYDEECSSAGKECSSEAEEGGEDDNDDDRKECSSSGKECSSEGSSEEEEIEATIPLFPVQVICMEYCENTFDDLILDNELSEQEWFSAFMQIIMILLAFQKAYSFTHNDLHSNNVMYIPTDNKYIYYCFKNKYYKVPTFGRIYKIIDFGRSIYKYDNKIYCSDSFQTGNDAATQYNTEPYFNENKPRLEPNFSFDLCRLACSIFDYVVDDLDEIKNLAKCKSSVRLIVNWCLDDNNLNMLYKSNGTERYPDFKLYKMIAKSVHRHTPEAQLERPEFKAFLISKQKLPSKRDSFINIDAIPCLYTV